MKNEPKLPHAIGEAVEKVCHDSVKTNYPNVYGLIKTLVAEGKKPEEVGRFFAVKIPHIIESIRAEYENCAAYIQKMQNN